MRRGKNSVPTVPSVQLPNPIEAEETIVGGGATKDASGILRTNSVQEGYEKTTHLDGATAKDATMRSEEAQA